MKVAVIGIGYVGLVSGVCLAEKGHDVTCVDLDQEIVIALNQGRPHIYERKLNELLGSVLKAGRFRATSGIEEALAGAELAMIAVGTPSENGVIDLRQVRAAAHDVGAAMGRLGKPLTVIVKSTVIPGTTDTVVRADLEQASGMHVGAFGLGMNPEFLREGEAVDDFLSPDRIVLGADDDCSRAALQALYAPWNCEKICVPTRTAELIKYANNALLAVQISAINEIANLAAAVGGIDVMEVIAGVVSDKRWSPIIDGRRIAPQILAYLIPGCGFGGSCFPKDLQALRSQGVQHGLDMIMMNAVLRVNDEQPHQVGNTLERELGQLAGKNVLVLGLAFKPGTDDVRESPALKIVADLLAREAVVTGHDPVAAEGFVRAMGEKARLFRQISDWRGGVATADIVVVVTCWPEYTDLPSLVRGEQIVFDARRMFDRRDFEHTKYMAIGLR